MYSDVCNGPTHVMLHPRSWDIYGRTGPETVHAIDLISHFLASRSGTSPARERFRLFTVLTSTVLQYAALAFNRRRLRYAPAMPKPYESVT